MELKVSRKGDDEKALLKEAKDKIIEKCRSLYDDPIALGIIINDETKAIMVWENFKDLRLKKNQTTR
jgi:hypothetical protein